MKQINSYELYQLLNQLYPVKENWPGENIWEIMVSAILVQNTTWHNTTLSLNNIRQSVGFEARLLAELSREEWINLIRPSGFYSNKSQTLVNWFDWHAQWDFDIDRLKKLFNSKEELRHHLLAFKGIGHETADVMLLYGFHEPVFIADAYARKLYTGLRGQNIARNYLTLKEFVEDTTHMTTLDWQLFHIQILNFGKEYLRGKGPHETELFNRYSIQLN